MPGTVFSGALTDQLPLPCAAKLQFDVHESGELFDSYLARCSVLPVELYTIWLTSSYQNVISKKTGHKIHENNLVRTTV